MNENTYRKRLTVAIVACVSVVIVCIGILSGGAYKQQTIQNELESMQAQLEIEQMEKLNQEEEASVLESQKQAAENELSAIKAEASSTTEAPSATEKSTKETSETASATRVITTAVPRPDKIPPKPATGDRKVYLTFDDGPSSNTPKILKILKQKNAKGTFFVANHPSYNHYMNDIVKSGNGIALHSYSHDYAKIYASDKSFYEDLKKISDVVKKETGVESKIYRFPGGSSNTVSRKYSSGIMTRVTKGITDKGYVYFDWNCNSGDAEGNNIPAATLVRNIKKGSGSMGGNIVVLMHDTGAKDSTVEALPEIIDFYRSRGFTFEVLTEKTPPVHHRVGN